MPTPLLFIAAILIWGSTFLVITFQLGEVAPAVSVVYRFGIGTLILFAWCAWRGDRLWLGWRRQPWLVMQGLLNFGLSYVCTYNAEGYLVSALVAVLFALMVFWNAIGARIFFGTRMTWHTICAALLAMGGVTLLFSHSLQLAWQAHEASSGQLLLGLGLALAATLSASTGNMVAVKVGREHGNNVVVTTAWAMWWGMLSVAIWALLTGQPWVLPRSPIYWSAMLYLALFGSVIAFTSYFTLINRIGPGRAAYTGVMTPVVSVCCRCASKATSPARSVFWGWHCAWPACSGRFAARPRRPARRRWPRPPISIRQPATMRDADAVPGYSSSMTTGTGRPFHCNRQTWPLRTLPTSAGRKQAMLVPRLLRTLG